MVTLDQQYKWNIQLAREEALAQGEARGRAQGEAIGEARGRERLAKLYAALEKENRLQDFSHAIVDDHYLQILYKELGI